MNAANPEGAVRTDLAVVEPQMRRIEIERSNQLDIAGDGIEQHDLTPERDDKPSAGREAKAPHARVEMPGPMAAVHGIDCVNDAGMHVAEIEPAGGGIPDRAFAECATKASKALGGVFHRQAQWLKARLGSHITRPGK